MVIWALANLAFPILFMPSLLIGLWLAVKRHPLFRIYLMIVGTALILGGAAGLTFGGHAVSHRLGRLRQPKQQMKTIKQTAQHLHQKHDTVGEPAMKVPAYPDPRPINPADIQPPGGQPYQAASEWFDGYLDHGLDFVAILGGVSTRVLDRGVLAIYVFNGGPQNLVPGEGIWVAPWSTGPITITHVFDKTIAWKAANGMTGTFIIDTHQWLLNP